MSASQDDQSDQIGAAEGSHPNGAAEGSHPDDESKPSANNRIDKGHKDESLEEDIKEHRGQRQMGEISIETFTIVQAGW